MIRQLHPSGYHYINVLMDDDYVFAEIFQCYKELESRIAWTSTLSLRTFIDLVQAGNQFDDPKLCFIIWHEIGELFQKFKRPTGPVILRYCEAVGDNLWPAQQANLNKCLRQAQLFDGLLVHTEFAKQFFAQKGIQAGLIPIGYNKTIMGSPDWLIKKEYNIVFYGSHVVGADGRNRRAEIINYLRKHLKSKLVDLSGTYQQNRQHALNKAKAILTLNQLNSVHSFPTMRIWHAIASSAGMIIESTGTWPAIPNQHFLSIPEITYDNAGIVAQHLVEKLSDGTMARLAKQAAEELSVYSYEKCLNDFAIPAIVAQIGC